MPFDLPYNTMVVLAGTGLLGAGAGLIGCFALLRGRALTGDALAHAALPGICIAFWILGRRDLYAMLLGALVSGIAGVLIVSLLRRYTRVKEDAALGIVLSTFFGAGIVLSRMIQNQSTAGSKAGLDSYIFGKTAGILLHDVYVIGGVAALSLLVVLFLFKEIKLVLFDSNFALVQGWPTVFLDLLLMSLVAITVVNGLPAVGVVLMAALLILPGAAARFWTIRLERMLVLAAIIGGATGVGGTLVSTRFAQAPAGPTLILVGATFFLFSALLAPHQGVIARAIRARNERRLITDRKVLRTLYDLSEHDLRFGSGSTGWTPSEFDGLTPISRIEIVPSLHRLFYTGYLDIQHGRYQWTPIGLQRAAEIALGSRLWETFLHAFPDSAPAFLNLTIADPRELIGGELSADLETALVNAHRWPKSLPLPKTPSPTTPSSDKSKGVA